MVRCSLASVVALDVHTPTVRAGSVGVANVERLAAAESTSAPGFPWAVALLSSAWKVTKLSAISASGASNTSNVGSERGAWRRAGSAARGRFVSGAARCLIASNRRDG